MEIVNSVTYGGVQTVQYPLAVYQRWFQRFFIYIIPLARVNYFPVLAILGRDDPLGSPMLLRWVAPVAGPLFLVGALQVWKLGVRHYTSTGS